MTADPADPAPPQRSPRVRARVLVPLVLLAVGAGLLYLIWGTRGGGPFGPLVSPGANIWRQ